MLPGVHWGKALVTLLILLLTGAMQDAGGWWGQSVNLPLEEVDTSIGLQAGKIIRVRAGGNFQQALFDAEPGDVIELAPGATYTGPFILPFKAGSQWIIIRSGDESNALPAPGTRVSPEYAPAMAKLVSRQGVVIATAPGAHHYRFIGIEIRPYVDEGLWRGLQQFFYEAMAREMPGPAGTYLTNLVMLSDASLPEAQIPHHLIFERCYLHGDPQLGTRRGIAMNSAYTAVVDSWLSDFKAVGVDSQAIAGWSGPGPYKIVNNYLEGAGENIMFGGGDPGIKNMVPSDIEIRRNHFSKPLAWKIDEAGYEGRPWAVKNLLELKNARRVLIDGNLFEYNWPHAQNGYAILFTVRNQDNTAPWSVVEDITFTNNIIRHVAAGINILGQDDIHDSQKTKNILIRNNLFEDMGGRWGRGHLFQLLDGTENILIEHNTAFNISHMLTSEGRPHKGAVIYANQFLFDQARSPDEGAIGTRYALTRTLKQALVKDNVISMTPLAAYPGRQNLSKIISDQLPPSLNNSLDAVTADESSLDDQNALPGINAVTLCAAMAISEQPDFCLHNDAHNSSGQ